MPTLAVTNFNIVLAVLGGWVSLFGLVSYLLKETIYLSEARTYYPPWGAIAYGRRDENDGRGWKQEWKGKC